MENVTLQIQSVLYHNEKSALQRALSNLSHAVKLNRETTGELGDVTVSYGDASKEPIFTEEEIRALNEQFEGAFSMKYRFFHENTGTAKGHNLLGDECTADYMLIMNPDVVAAPRLFHALLTPFSDPSLNAGMTEARQVPIEHPKEYDKKTFETSWASTACAMFPTDVFRQVGGFDAERFFMYCDDLDFSWRVRLAGKKIYYRPDACVFHAKTLSSTGSWQPTSAEIYYSAEAALIMSYRWSNNERFHAIYKSYVQSKDEILLRAVRRVDEMKKSGLLSEQLDPSHKVSTFTEDQYSKVRFSL